MKIPVTLILCILISCTGQQGIPEVQGHRGCRGLMPENTVAGFIHAVDLGVHTLELDVVISGDSQVIVSHEPYFSHLISTGVDGTEVTESNEKDFNIYRMTLADIRKFDVGLKPHPKYPLQTKQPAVKPTLGEVIEAVEKHINKNKLDPVRYNIEIKHISQQENDFYPPCPVSADLVYKEVVKWGIRDQSNIQSFDPGCLNEMHKKDKDIVIAFLVENGDPVEKNLQKLDFKPQIYSPYFGFVNEKMVQQCKKLGLKLIPWTINEAADIEKMYNLGVDGVITDYPDKALEIRKSIYAQ
jgi:glycerophosphoryl diester phosphodiesterase